MYQEIYPFSVEGAIKQGAYVRVVDKAHGRVFPCNDMKVEDFYDLIREAEKDATNRYLFYVRVEKTGDEQNAED